MAARLTAQEKLERKMTGGRVQAIAIEVLEGLGWTWCHWRALQTRRGIWMTGVEGPLGKGWPDLFALHPAKGALGIECKRELGDPITPEQQWVGEQLQAAGIRWAVLRPSDVRDPLETSTLVTILMALPNVDNLHRKA